MEHSGTANRRSRTVAIVLAVLVLTGVAIWLASLRISPMLEARIKGELARRYQSEIELRSLTVTVFPQARIVGEGLAFRNVQIAKFTAEASFFGLLATPTRIRLVRLEGLQIQVHPNGGQAGHVQHRQPRPFILDEVIADGTVLEIIPKTPGKDPKIFHIAKLKLRSAGPDRPMNFVAALTNPTPPGTIDTFGQFGPWQVEEPGQTPVSGNYTFRDADLSVFKGISGKLNSEGSYQGVLERIDVNGKTDTPDFALKKSGNRVDLKTEFHAVVDGVNGDTYLDPVTAHFLRTTVIAHGDVTGAPGEPGKTVSLNVSVDHGRLEDLLHLAVSGPEPPMTGSTSFHAKLVIPPGKVPVIEKLHLTGTFGIGGAQFTNFNVREKVAGLSHRAQGEPNETGDHVVSQLRGAFTVHAGHASFDKLTFAVPGARIELSGSYGIDGDELDFHGSARTDATISQMTTGVKSFLLKAVDPFFRKDGAGAVIPIAITGTRANPKFGLEFRRRK